MGHPSEPSGTPLRVINSVAPIRICDNGGWTDTWFAGHGVIFNIGVYPYVEVQIKVYPARSREERVVLYAENYGDAYTVVPGNTQWIRHPLLEAAIEYMGIPDDISLHITVYSEVPAGCSTGTSASITVALIGALDRLTPGTMTAHEVAYAAHRVETDLLKLQSGIQDQLCAAYGGLSFIEMHHYPFASVSPIQVPNSIWWELERRLVLFFLGKAHQSSPVHEAVIRKLEEGGPEGAALDKLRQTARMARDAVCAGDWNVLGRSMSMNTEAQTELNAALVGKDAHLLIDVAKANGAIGWKVNGAGGDGGSITLLCGQTSSEKRALIRAVQEANPAFRPLPIYLSRYGLRVWEGM
ncbi:MAG: GHMP kinase [Anaerolineae bacterium]|nr:GHMP kinase [Anaerolineae bacterium]